MISISKLAAIIILIIFTSLAIFQVSLVFGAPFGHFAWGGQNKVLPLQFRIGSIISVLLYVLFCLIALDKSHTRNIFKKQQVSQIGSWVIVGYSFVGIFMNGLSKSNSERNLMTPLTAIIFLLFLLIAMSEKK